MPLSPAPLSGYPPPPPPPFFPLTRRDCSPPLWLARPALSLALPLYCYNFISRLFSVPLLLLLPCRSFVPPHLQALHIESPPGVCVCQCVCLCMCVFCECAYVCVCMMFISWRDKQDTDVAYFLPSEWLMRLQRDVC